MVSNKSKDKLVVEGDPDEESESNQLYQKEFLEDLLLDNEADRKQSFISIPADEELGLLDEDFGDNDSVEDPFAIGNESIMKDIMEDEVYQRNRESAKKINN